MLGRAVQLATLREKRVCVWLLVVAELAEIELDRVLLWRGHASKLSLFLRSFWFDRLTFTRLRAGHGVLDDGRRYWCAR
jgi:hypothetical protein